MAGAPKLANTRCALQAWEFVCLILSLRLRKKVSKQWAELVFLGPENAQPPSFVGSQKQHSKQCCLNKGPKLSKWLLKHIKQGVF